MRGRSTSTPRWGIAGRSWMRKGRPARDSGGPGSGLTKGTGWGGEKTKSWAADCSARSTPQTLEAAMKIAGEEEGEEEEVEEKEEKGEEEEEEKEGKVRQCMR